MVLLLALSTASCQSNSASTSRGINLWHVVLVKLKDPADEAAKQKIIDVSKSFRAIPGVLSVHAGAVSPSERPNQSDDFDIGIVMGFQSHQAVQSYVNHPLHKKAVEEVLKPLAKGYTAYDFLNE